MSEETTEQLTNENILQAILKRFDAVDLQLEAIRQGLVQNSAAFDRLEGTVFSSRSDVANLRADVKQLSEEIRQVKSVV